MIRLVYVHYNDGTTESFGAPDGWRVPALFPREEWLVIPAAEDRGETAELLIRLTDVKWISTCDEVQ